MKAIKFFALAMFAVVMASCGGSSKWDAAKAEELGKKINSKEAADKATDEEIKDVVDLVVLYYNDGVELANSDEYKNAKDDAAKKQLVDKFNNEHKGYEAILKSYEFLKEAKKVADTKPVDDAKKAYDAAFPAAKDAKADAKGGQVVEEEEGNTTSTPAPAQSDDEANNAPANNGSDNAAAATGDNKSEEA